MRRAILESLPDGGARSRGRPFSSPDALGCREAHLSHQRRHQDGGAKAGCGNGTLVPSRGSVMVCRYVVVKGHIGPLLDSMPGPPAGARKPFSTGVAPREEASGIYPASQLASLAKSRRQKLT